MALLSSFKRNAAMPHSNTSEGRRVGLTIDNMWKIFLLFVLVGLLNNVYVTKHVLIPQIESYRHDRVLHSSFVGTEGGVNSTSLKLVKGVNGDEAEVVRAAKDTAIKINQEMTAAQSHFTKVRGNKLSQILSETRKSPKLSFFNQNKNSTNRVRVSVPKASHASKNLIAADTTKDAVKIEYRPRIPTRAKRKKRRRHHKKDENRTKSPEQLAKWAIHETVPMSNVSNSIYYRDIPQEFLVEDPSTFLWDRPELMIPEWMKDYFRWHRWKRSTWKDPASDNNEDWRESERWLISQCLMSQDKRKCGGTADRLKPIPTLLRTAYENKRVFLIRWTRPAPLEEFLLPPAGGFDWRIPPALDEYIEDKSKGKRLATKRLILEYAANGLSLVRARYQTGTPDKSYNELVFDTNSTELGAQDNQEQFGFEPLFSRVWSVLFTPSPPIQEILQSRLSSLGLVPNEYVASHLRALYAVDDRPLDEIHTFTENALACATNVYPGVPIFFASDAAQALEHAQNFNGKQVQDDANQTIRLKVVTAADDKKASASGETPNNDNSTLNHPWHLDSYIGPVENFYDTFVDLYMLAMAGCVTYGKGGYGHWGMLIGGHTQCQLRQHLIGSRYRDEQLCKFRASTESFETITTNFHDSHPSVFGNGSPESGPIFLPPME